MPEHLFLHELVFKKPAGTSRGILLNKPSWILNYPLSNGQQAQTEFPVIPGLSPDYQNHEQYERDLNRGIAQAQLDPGAAARASLQAGIGQIGRGIAGAMSIQDPQTQRYTQLLFNQCMFGFGYQLKN